LEVKSSNVKTWIRDQAQDKAGAGGHSTTKGIDLITSHYKTRRAFRNSSKPTDPNSSVNPSE